MDERELARLREAFAALSGSARGTDECPAADRIWIGARGGLRPGDVKVLVDHTLDCPACAESWRLAAELERGVGAAPEATESAELRVRFPRGPSARGAAAAGWRRLRRPGGWILAAAAALVLGVVGIRVLQHPEPMDTGTYRSPEETGLRSLVPEDRLLPREACVLQWSAGPEGARYNVRVATEDLREITSARGLADARFSVPGSLLRDLPPRARLLWQVEILLPDGKRQMSRTFVNQLE